VDQHSHGFFLDGRRYAGNLEHFKRFIEGVSGLIKDASIPSLVQGCPDDRGFRFGYLGESYILRHSFEMSSGEKAGSGMIAIYAIDGMDDRKSTKQGGFVLTRHGEVLIPDLDYSPSGPGDAAFILSKLLAT
jgi:hypothetical protein